MLGPRKLALTQGEIVVSFLLPPRPPRSGDAYLRFIPRTEMDIAVVGAGVTLSLDGGGTITAARVSLGAVAARVLLVPEAAQAIIGSRLDRAAQDRLEAAARAACRPIDDKRGTTEFRIDVAAVLARRTALIALDRARTQLMAKHHIEATVNGDAVEFLCETEETLLDVLRDTLDLTGSKEGCASGDCGACSVMLDGRLVCSCLVLGCEVGGRRVETIEGMAKGETLHPLQQRFLEAAALQCGICTPGLPDGQPGPAREDAGPDRARGALLAGRQPLPVHRLRQDRDRGDGHGRGDEKGIAMAETNGQRDCRYVGTRTIRPDGVDKVTGRARFGADFNLPGQLVGRVLRSPHPHARILSIDTSKAEALPGVKAVVTRDDFADQPSEFIPAGEMMMNYKDVVRNVMAREKALYEGHAVAAVAATSAAVARRALKLIDVEYEVLPHVIDVVEAMRPDAPLLHDDLFTVGVEPRPDKPSNIAKRVEIKQGDVEAGFQKADVIVEREFKTAAVHQGYIEPHAALGSVSEDGSAELWCCTQGHFIVRAHCARLLGLDIGKVRVTATEIGGGFGGKTVVYLEPLALALSRKAKRPVKMVMSREEVFKASGPTSGAVVRVKMGATRGRQVRGRASPSSSTRRAPSRARRCSPAPCAPTRRTTSRTCT